METMEKLKLNILFVDDEANVILGLKRMLRVFREDWNFFFSQSGNDALEIMSHTEMHVIVSDMRMPQMNGAELLEIVKEKYPATIRVILSGQSDEELALKSTRTAHKFISKPAEPEILKQTILQTYNLHQSLNDEVLRKVINGINRLPSLPKTYLEVENELAKENFSLQKITEIISNDMIMSVKILQIVNSAFFGLPQKLSNLGQAINLIGANTIKSLIIYVQVFKTFEGNTKISKLLEEIWEHSLTVAKCSKLITSKVGKNPKGADEAYIAGLLHDIGKIVILSTPKYRDLILKYMEENDSTYNIAEKKILEITHSEVGGYLLCLWGLPETVIESVLYHHGNEKMDFSTINTCSTVYLANFFIKQQETENELKNINCSKEELDEIRGICENILHKE